MQGLDRTMWLQVREAVRTVGRAQELFLINMTSPTWYFGTNHYASSSSTPSGSGAPMDIGAANTCPQRGKGIQCYNCQGFGHISCKCTQPRWAWQQSPQQGWAVQPQVDPHSDDERVKAVQGMLFAEMHDYFKNLKDQRVMMKQASLLSSLNWTLKFTF